MEIRFYRVVIFVLLAACLAACPKPIFGSREETEDALMQKHFG